MTIQVTIKPISYFCSLLCIYIYIYIYLKVYVYITPSKKKNKKQKLDVCQAQRYAKGAWDLI